MLEVIKFILKLVVDFVAMLFTIDVGFTSLGMVMCICFIFFPVVLAFVNFLKGSLLEEIDDRYDWGKRLSYRQSNYKPKHAKKG